MSKSILLKELQELLDKPIDPTMFPFQKGNSIRIGQYIVREKKNGKFRVYDCKNNHMITELFCKSSAVALAKTMAKGNTTNISSIQSIDKEIQKWYNDCVFYRHTLKVTKDCIKKDIVETRYEIARDKTTSIRKQLDKYIYA